MSPRVNYPEPPVTGDLKLDRYLQEVHRIIFGYGAGGEGQLDGVNMVTPVPIADGGTGGTTDPYSRSNHTGTQLAATIADFNATVLTVHSGITGLHSTLKQAASLADGTASAVSVTSADASAVYGAGEQALLNELKGDVNTLATDLNALITKINTLLANLRTAALQAT